MLIWIIIISVILMALFIGVSIAGGRAHDRANAEAARRENRPMSPTDSNDDQRP
jgi:hypothetical protein